MDQMRGAYVWSVLMYGDVAYREKAESIER
jgi:hypothetical protein